MSIKLSIIVVNYNSPQLLERCLFSIDKFLLYKDREIIIVDNDSSDENLEKIKDEYCNVNIIRLPENMGFGYANNVGVRNAGGDVILLLNSDTELIDNGLDEAIKIFIEQDVTEMWGFKLLWPDGTFQNSFSKEIKFIDFLLSYTSLSGLKKYIKRIRDHKFAGADPDGIHEVPIIYGTVMLLRRKDFLNLNGFDTKYFMYFEDVDFCERFRRILRGKIIYQSAVSIIHHVSGSKNTKRKTNPAYIKSKYKYGFGKFKAGMILFFFVDVFSSLFRRLTNLKR